MAICSDDSYPFVFPPKSKRPPLDILKYIVTKLSNKEKEFAFMLVYEDGALERSSEFMNKFHIINIIVQTTDGDVFYLNGKI